jgi:hypothetical protein
MIPIPENSKGTEACWPIKRVRKSTKPNQYDISRRMLESLECVLFLKSYETIEIPKNINESI